MEQWLNEPASNYMVLMAIIGVWYLMRRNNQ